MCLNIFLQNKKSSNDSINQEFIDDLEIFEKKTALLKELPNNTQFIIDRIEANFAVCENQTTGKMFDIPISLLNFEVKEFSSFILKDSQNLIFESTN